MTEKNQSPILRVEKLTQEIRLQEVGHRLLSRVNQGEIFQGAHRPSGRGRAPCFMHQFPGDSWTRPDLVWKESEILHSSREELYEYGKR